MAYSAEAKVESKIVSGYGISMRRWGIARKEFSELSMPWFFFGSRASGLTASNDDPRAVGPSDDNTESLNGVFFDREHRSCLSHRLFHVRAISASK
jgi:hypothetical protein